MRDLDLVVKLEKNKLATDANGNCWVYLLEIQISPSETLYLTNNHASVPHNSIVYTAFPFVVGEMTEDGKGNLSSISLTVDNTTLEVSRWLELNDGASFKRVVLTKFLIYDDGLSITGAAAVTETFRVSTVAENEKACVFTLGQEDLLKLDVPRETFNRRRCPFEYKGPRCKYAGILENCDKTLRGRDGCEAHDNVENFGGFPGVPIQ